ncbi:Planctomycete cytochrome C [Stieleria maiorica]|uniref:Planctomycete cytochrome C n=1 Tax=Stieleria maiorica TaxID=2795974 RepID=A0A5B9MEQ3_9BACT|nr:PSD1 and planctomycete cytochrome C domain-containing protein [Stieleria maiorica]QEF98470.1 Planctomycete cytochrome C [Stieleria maiorica]
MRRSCCLLLWVLTGLVWCGVARSAGSDDRIVSFNQEVRPILSDTCFFCHGPDEEDRQADVRLDVAGHVDLEELVARITSDDPDLLMPPPESNKSLSPDQITTLTRWVNQGARYEKHWSFTPPAEVAAPTIPGAEGLTSGIDRFVVAALRERGMTFNEAADERTLIRRVTMDLTGLPPTRDQIRAFLDDTSPQAYENLVDRLLESPQYGEHMARYWLDLVRFADTNGLHHDHYREMTPYRDWVIRAFNDNMPMDEFTIAQIAGDLYEQPTTDQLIASGFNRLHLIIDRGTALPEESFMRNVVDRVSAVGTAFLGLTLECAVCHDHKYDPITQRDFYQFYAFFNNFDGEPETGGRRGLDFKRGLQPPYLELPSKDQEAELARLNQQIADVRSSLKQLDQAAKADEQASQNGDLPNGDPESERGDVDPTRKQLGEELNHLQAARDRLIESIPATLIMKERAEVRPAHILVRGNYDQPGEMVQRDTPSFLPPMKSDRSIKTRMDLAQWLVDPDNPLTARVAVNRFWQQLFGVGIVKTSEDFGAQGEPPSHPALLDHLTNQFIESGWDVKALLRQIVLSQTYRQSSAATPQQYVADPQNRWLARGSRYRYDAEVIRDQVLAVSGLLNPTLYGKSVKPPQPEGLWKIVAMPYSYPRVFEPDQGDKIYRRSVYSFWKRGLPPPQMTIFDAPTRESCSARRERTNTPLQALVLMNEQQYFNAAMTLASQLLQQSEMSDRQRIELAYESITSKIPSDSAMNRMLDALQQFQSVYRDNPEAASKMVSLSGPQNATHDQSEPDLAAMTMLVHSLLNLDATKTRE